jgi:hypothetical protein
VCVSWIKIKLYVAAYHAHGTLFPFLLFLAMVYAASLWVSIKSRKY